MHLFIGKPHLDLAKTADTLLTPVFAIGKYNTSVHSSRITAVVKCQLTDRRVLAFLNRQQAGCCEGASQQQLPKIYSILWASSEGSACLLPALGRQGALGCLGVHKKAQNTPNPAGTPRRAVPLWELTKDLDYPS